MSEGGRVIGVIVLVAVVAAAVLVALYATGNLGDKAEKKIDDIKAAVKGPEPPETKDPGQQNGSDDASLTSGPCVYGGTNEGKFDDGFHCKMGVTGTIKCPQGAPKGCWTYKSWKYYTMPADFVAEPGNCPLGGTDEGMTKDGRHCRLGPKKTTDCPAGADKCWNYNDNKYYTFPF